jgi:hypothetical protein
MVQWFHNARRRRFALAIAGRWVMRTRNLVAVLIGGVLLLGSLREASAFLEEFKGVFKQHESLIRRYAERLQGSARLAFQHWVRGLAFSAVRADELMERVGRTGLGLVRAYRRVLRNALAAAIRRSEATQYRKGFGTGMVEAVHHDLMIFGLRLRQVWNQLGAPGDELLRHFHVYLLRFRDQVRELAKGRARYAKGWMKGQFSGFRSKIEKAARVMTGRMKSNSAKARKSVDEEMSPLLTSIKSRP